MSDTLIPFDGSVVPFTGAVASVTLTLTTPSLEVGTVGAASVAVRDADGNDLAGRTVTWASSNDTVVADPAAGVTNSAGVATVQLPALAAGTTSFSAACEGVASSPVTITVAIVDVPDTYDAVGATTIIATAVDRMAIWERAQERRFNDADQKRLYPTDRFFEGLEESVDLEIVWPSKELLRRHAS